MKKTAKISVRVLLVLLLVILLALVSVVLWVKSHEEEVKRIFIKEVNTSLKTKISVDDISLSFLQTFPRVGLRFNNVKMHGSNPKDTALLLDAQRLYLSFDLLDLYYGIYTVQVAELEDAKVHIKYCLDKSDNYSFWQDSLSKGQFSFELQRINGKNVKIIYENASSKSYYSTEIFKGVARGNFSERMQHIRLKGDGYIYTIRSDGFALLNNKNLTGDVVFDVDSDKDIVTFHKGDLFLEKVPFDFTGKIIYTDDREAVDIIAKAKKISYKNLISLLPDSLQTALENYDGSADMDLTIVARGPMHDVYFPYVHADFQVHNGSILHKQSKTKISGIAFAGTFTNGSKQHPSTFELHLNKMSASMEGNHFSGEIFVQNFLNPLVRLNAKAQFDLEKISRFLNLKDVETLTGKVDLNMHYENRLSGTKMLTSDDFLSMQMQGDAKIHQLQLKLKENPNEIALPTADLQFDNLQLNIANAKILVNNQALNVSGQIHNWWPYLRLQNGNLAVNLNVQGGEIDLKNILLPLSVSEKTPKTATDEGLPFSKNIRLNLQTSFEKCKYDNILVENVEAVLRFQDNIGQLNINQLRTLKGSMTGALMVDARMDDRLLLQFSGHLDKIDLNKLLVDFDNFGQNVITDKNIYGQITSDIQCSMVYLLKERKIDRKSLLLSTQNTLENGRLQKFEPMRKLSRFLNEDSLSDIRFQTMQTSLEIKNEVCTIDQLKIASNAMNLEASGITYCFDGRIKANIKIALSELLTKRRKARQQKEKVTEFGVEEEEMTVNNNRLMIPITVSGTIDNPIFKYGLRVERNSEAAKNGEVKTVKQMLNEQFRETERVKENRQQQADWKEQEKGKFLIDFEDKPDTLKPAASTKKSQEKGKFKIEFDDN